MGKRYVVLGNGRMIGLGSYVTAWKKCLQMDPNAWIGAGVSGFGQTAGEALEDLRRGMHDRINRRIPGHGIGRKWCDNWQATMRRASRDLNEPKLIIDWLPPDLKSRFSHRLRENRI